jgi:hypothetical protein
MFSRFEKQIHFLHVKYKLFPSIRWLKGIPIKVLCRFIIVSRREVK